MFAFIGALFGPVSSAWASITEYPVPTAASNLFGITAGPDAAVWFAEENGNKVGRISTSGTITEYPSPGSGPYGITAGPDGALWFTDRFSAGIGRITTSGSSTEFPIPGGGSPAFIVTGPDGALWFTDDGGNFIGRVTTSGSFSKYPVPTAASSPYAIAVGSDGALWFTERLSSKVGRIATDGTITEYAVPMPGSTPNFIAAGPDGALWFTDDHTKSIWRVTTSGSFTDYPIPGGGCPEGITAGPDGALWFADGCSNFVGRVTTSGSFTEYTAPTTSSFPNLIASGSDGALWFTENVANQIGRVTTPGPGPPATLALSPKAATGTVGTQHCVTATVTDASNNPTPNVTVRFSISGSVNTTGTQTTDSSGTAQFCYQGPNLPGADSITAYADTNDNGTQDLGEPGDEATMAWLLPTATAGQVTGGGQLQNANGQSKIAFGFTAKSDATGTTGECTVVDNSPAINIKIKCIDVTTLVETGNNATFFGDATVNGTATTYRIDVEDNGTPGAGADTFSIQTASGYTASGTLVDGNIQVHT